MVSCYCTLILGQIPPFLVDFTTIFRGSCTQRSAKVWDASGFDAAGGASEILLHIGGPNSGTYGKKAVLGVGYPKLLRTTGN
jgi:hypothetical protein